MSEVRTITRKAKADDLPKFAERPEPKKRKKRKVQAKNPTNKNKTV